MGLQNRNVNASMQKALTMVQQKKLGLAALKASAEAVLATSDDTRLGCISAPDEIMKILDKDLEQALILMQQTETELTQMLIGKTGHEHLEVKVEFLQKLAMKLTELKRPCLVLASQDDCGYIETKLKCFQLNEDHSNRFESWIQDHSSRIMDRGSRMIQDLVSWIEDPGSRGLDSGSIILDPRAGSGSRILDPETSIQDS